MSKPKFSLNLSPVTRQAKSAAQDLAFGRMDLESAARFLANQPIADDLRRALAALPQATVRHIGCYRCNGDVPLDQPDLVADGLCRPCADDYDRAAAERRQQMRQARLDQRHAA